MLKLWPCLSTVALPCFPCFSHRKKEPEIHRTPDQAGLQRLVREVQAIKPDFGVRRNQARRQYCCSSTSLERWQSWWVHAGTYGDGLVVCEHVPCISPPTPLCLSACIYVYIAVGCHAAMRAENIML